MNFKDKNKTYFVVSDLHSFYRPFKINLFRAGFRKTNPNHILIVLGDIFDRGDDTLKVFELIKSIPSNRRIMIKGNHEELFIKLAEKTFPDSYDFSNGTVKTFCHIAGVSPDDLDISKIFSKAHIEGKVIDYAQASNRRQALWYKIIEKVKESEIYNWILSNEWLDYFELNNHIFVHSFIPLRCKNDKTSKLFEYYPLYSIPLQHLAPVPNWRTDAYYKEWEESRWGCPYKEFDAGLFNNEIKNNKVLVCGHWYTSDFHLLYENKKNDFSIYYSKNLIALDACTAYSKTTNVLVIKQDACFDQHKNLLNY